MASPPALIRATGDHLVVSELLPRGYFAALEVISMCFSAPKDEKAVTTCRQNTRSLGTSAAGTVNAPVETSVFSSSKWGFLLPGLPSKAFILLSFLGRPFFCFTLVPPIFFTFCVFLQVKTQMYGGGVGQHPVRVSKPPPQSA